MPAAGSGQMRRQTAVTRPVVARTVTIIARADGAVNTVRSDRAQGHKFRGRPFMPRHNQHARRRQGLGEGDRDRGEEVAGGAALGDLPVGHHDIASRRLKAVGVRPAG
jgi:hypothetical protein